MPVFMVMVKEHVTSSATVWFIDSNGVYGTEDISSFTGTVC